MPPLQPDASRGVAAYRWLKPEIFQPEVDCAVTTRQTSFSMVKFLPRVSDMLRLQPNILAILSVAHSVIGRMRLFPADGPSSKRYFYHAFGLLRRVTGPVTTSPKSLHRFVDAI